MTEAWKSTGKKFCELCKVWFADNRLSSEHHERGEKHKAAIQQKLRDLGKTNKEKQQKQGELNAILAQMEQGALASVNKHGDALPHGPSMPPERGLGIGPRVPSSFGTKYLDPKEFKSVGAMAAEMKRRKEAEEKKKEAAKVETKSSLWRDDDYETPIPKIDPVNIVWVEADAEDGKKYYYHMFTGETAWEPPDSFFTQEEYQRRLDDLDRAAIERESRGLPADPSQGTMISRYGEEIAAPPPLQVAKRKKPRPLEDIEKYEKKPRYENPYDDPNYGNVQHQAPDQSSYEYTPMPEAPLDMADIPMPGEAPPVSTTSFTVSSGGYKTAPLISLLPQQPLQLPQRQHIRRRNMPPPPPVPVPRPDAFVPEEEEEGEEPTTSRDVKLEENSEIEQFGDANDGPTIKQSPLGAWTRVFKAPDAQPYLSPHNAKFREMEEKKRQYELKEQEEKDKKEKMAIPEEKYEFKEKTAAVMTKKLKAPVEFKKRTANRSVRQRMDD